MLGLWDIAIGKNKPTGDPVQPTAAAPGAGKDDDGTPEIESDASDTGKKEQERGIEEQDTKEYVEYEGVQVSKRTKYRVWKEFENGTHSTSIWTPSYTQDD